MQFLINFFYQRCILAELVIFAQNFVKNFNKNHVYIWPKRKSKVSPQIFGLYYSDKNSAQNFNAWCKFRFSFWSKFRFDFCWNFRPNFGQKLPFFRGKYCQAIGKDWHPECFKCQSPGCQMSLQTTGFIEDQGKVFCRNCFERDIAYTCAKCNRKIIGVSTGGTALTDNPGKVLAKKNVVWGLKLAGIPSKGKFVLQTTKILDPIS